MKVVVKKALALSSIVVCGLAFSGCMKQAPGGCYQSKMMPAYSKGMSMKKYKKSKPVYTKGGMKSHYSK